jgi:cell wall-associated NlpC family hydrolase
MPEKLTAKLDRAAVDALTDNDFERKPGMCQRFVRQVVQRVAGSRYDRFFLGTANLSARAFLGTSYVVPDAVFGVPGDLLYWYGSRGQTAGHAAIRITGDRIAQNSITDKWDLATGHKGTRKISEMRTPDLVVRLR